MRKINLTLLFVLFGITPAIAAEFNVPGDGTTLLAAINAANSNADETNTIYVSGAQSGGGSPQKSMTIIGQDNASITGSFSFSGGIGMTTTISDMTVGRVDNGDGFAPQEGHTLTLKNINISNAASAAIANDGQLTIDGGVYTNNKNGSNGGGAVMNITTETTYIKGGARFEGNSTSGGTGGAIQNQSTGAMDVDGAVFIGNTATYYGGAIGWGGNGSIKNAEFTNNVANAGGALYFTDSTATLDIIGSEFTGNHTTGSQPYSSYGGAISGAGTINISDTIFDGNYAQSGGAIEHAGVLDITGGEFKNNYALGYGGGGIDFDGVSLSISGTQFTNNQARATSGDGGAIYANGTSLTIDDGASFYNNTAGDGGGAIYAQAGLTITGTADKHIIFDTNTSGGAGGAVFYAKSSPLDISYTDFTGNISNDDTYGAGALYISSGSNVATLDNVKFERNTTTMYGGAIFAYSPLKITGNSTFEKNTAAAGGAIFAIRDVTLDSSDGHITFTGNTTTMTAAEGGGGADIYLNASDDVNLNITGTSMDWNVSMDGGIAGTGYINKSGDNTFRMKLGMDNSGWEGYFVQTGGNTIVENSASMFGGGIDYNSVEHGRLFVDSGSYTYGVTLGDEGELQHQNSTAATSNIGSANLRFSGENAFAQFGKVSSLTSMANYTLVDKIENGKRNEVRFLDSNVFIASNDYVGETDYVFYRSNISLSGPEEKMRTATFTDLSAKENTSLSFDIYAAPEDGEEVFTTDRLVVLNKNETDRLNLGAVRILGRTDYGLDGLSTATVLEGIRFVEGQKMTISTQTYQYEVTTVDYADGDIIGSLLDLNVIGRAGYGSLYGMTKLVDETRAFNFSFYDGKPNVHTIGQMYEESVGAGDFYIQGFNENAEDSVISAIITNEEDENFGEHSKLFTVSNATNFRINDLTIQDAVGTNGSVLDITNGAAVVTLDNMIIRNNTATGSGGAISNSDGFLRLTGVRMIENHADVNGGAIFDSTDEDTQIFENSKFINNTAAGLGGAIYNTGNLTLKSSYGDIEFTGNTDTNGLRGNDIYSDGGTINITGGANRVIINSGIDGTVDSVINKTGAGILEINGNSPYMGTFTQTAGTTNVTAGRFFMGTSNIQNGSMLHFFNDASGGTVNLTNKGMMDLRSASNVPAGWLPPTFSADDLMARRAGRPSTFAAAAPQFNNLYLESFNGDGTGMIFMSTDGTSADLLTLTDTATGSAILSFNAIGGSPTKELIQVVNLDRLANKDNISFTLHGNTVDVGAWEYSLGQESDENWYLKMTGNSSTMAEVVGGIPALHLTIVKSGMNELRKRMGALRNNNDDEGLVGFWIREYGKHMKTNELSDSTMNLLGIEGGFDIMMNALNGKVYLGVMAGILGSEDIDVITSRGAGAGGWTRTPSVGAYLTWMHKSASSSKWFVDLTARHFWVNTHITRDDEANGYDVQRGFWAFSGEVGKLYYMRAPDWMNVGTVMDSHISIEPKIEVRYGLGESMNFKTFNETAGYVHETRALSTRLYTQINFLPNSTDSIWKPYLELGVYNEWAGETDMEFAGEKLTVSDTSGFGFEATLGVNATITENSTYVYGAVTGEFGEIYTSYLFNLGIRTKF